MDLYSRRRRHHDHLWLGKPFPIHSHLVVEVSCFIGSNACAWYFFEFMHSTRFFPIEIHINAKSIELNRKNKILCTSIRRKCESNSQFRWVLVHGRVHSIEQTDQALMMILRRNNRFFRTCIDAIQSRCAFCDLCSHLFFLLPTTNSQHDHIFSFISAIAAHACMQTGQILSRNGTVSVSRIPFFQYH